MAKVQSRRIQLDSLRGIAVLLVVVHHWIEPLSTVGLGNIGVQLFFVLSGFLITRSLLMLKHAYETDTTTFLGALSIFQLSRIARIWPVYFFTLALVFLAGDRFEQSGAMAWHALFGSNILFFLRGEFDSSLAHFWSLAVEQQFYLIWPILVLWLPSRWMKVLALVLVVQAPLFRLALWSSGLSEFAQYNTLTPANFDSLGLGALSALCLTTDDRLADRSRAILGQLTAVAAVTLLPAWFSGGYVANLEQSLYAVIFAWIAVKANVGFSGDVGSILNSHKLAFIGKISYGIYVYHMFMPRLVGAAWRALGVPESAGATATSLLMAAVITLLLATLSWRFLERPVLNWSRRFLRGAALERHKSSIGKERDV